MNKRVFSPIRLYKIARVAVIGVSLLALIFGFNVYKNSRSSSALDGVSLCDKLYGLDMGKANELWYKNNNDPLASAYIKCVSDAMGNINAANTMWFTSFIVAFGLPILFFGGSLFINYLFPSSEDHK